jgi:hypothetical protein
MHSRSYSSFLLAACLLAGACRDPGAGPYHVSGKVTFNGQPVPAGKIYFHPDIPRGNVGPPAFAEITNGAYDTRKGGTASQGGPVIVAIEGFDGKTSATDKMGQPLFPEYDILDAVLPRANAVMDFDVPASAAAKSQPKTRDPGP